MLELVKKKIEEAGHRAVVKSDPDMTTFRVNVLKDKKGEYFDIHTGPMIKTSVIAAKGDHLLLMFDDGEKFKTLIGHDERQLFVAAIPEGAPVVDVRTAKEALKPKAVLEYEKSAGIKYKKKHKRKIGGRKRQGDFFFIPEDPQTTAIIHKNEPISRGSGTNHICSELVRSGGERVYSNRAVETGWLTLSEKNKWIKDNPEKIKRLGSFWTERVRGMVVYVRGTIRHPEHKTLVLDDWHKVIPNTEAESKMMKHMAFVD